MCNTDNDLKKGRGNGTTCQCTGVTLKVNANVLEKNRDGKSVNTVSSDDVQWLNFENYPKAPRNAGRCFKLSQRNLSKIAISNAPS